MELVWFFLVRFCFLEGCFVRLLFYVFGIWCVLFVNMILLVCYISMLYFTAGTDKIKLWN